MRRASLKSSTFSSGSIDLTEVPPALLELLDELTLQLISAPGAAALGGGAAGSTLNNQQKKRKKVRDAINIPLLHKMWRTSLSSSAKGIPKGSPKDMPNPGRVLQKMQVILTNIMRNLCPALDEGSFEESMKNPDKLTKY